MLCLLYQAVSPLQTKKNDSGQEDTTYRDLNKNGQKDIYEDPAQPIDKRIEDLLSQMNIEEKAGLMFNAISGIDFGEGMERVDSLISQVHINHLDMPGRATAKEILEYSNLIQKKAEDTRFGHSRYLLF